MFSKFVCSFAVRQSSQKGIRMAPRAFNKPNQMVAVSQRGFLDRLGLESTNKDLVAGTASQEGGEVSLWKDQVKH